MNIAVVKQKVLVLKEKSYFGIGLERQGLVLEKRSW